jgi:hypothetical protein
MAFNKYRKPLFSPYFVPVSNNLLRKKMYKYTLLKSKTYVASRLFPQGSPKYADYGKEPQDSNTLRLHYLTSDCQLFFSLFVNLLPHKWPECGVVSVEIPLISHISTCALRRKIKFLCNFPVFRGGPAVISAQKQSGPIPNQSVQAPK